MGKLPIIRWMRSRNLTWLWDLKISWRRERFSWHISGRFRNFFSERSPLEEITFLRCWTLFIWKISFSSNLSSAFLCRSEVRSWYTVFEKGTRHIGHCLGFFNWMEHPRQRITIPHSGIRRVEGFSKQMQHSASMKIIGSAGNTIMRSKNDMMMPIIMIIW